MKFSLLADGTFELQCNKSPQIVKPHGTGWEVKYKISTISALMNNTGDTHIVRNLVELEEIKPEWAGITSFYLNTENVSHRTMH